jgi:hypothetical protein
MYPFMASFYNKITNNVSQGQERGEYVLFNISCSILNLHSFNILYGCYLSGEHLVAGFSVRLSVRPSILNSCQSHNFVIWSQNLQLFHRNDHHIETMCRAQHLGHYLEGQGHSMTLKQNRVQPITSLFEVGFLTYFTERITI